MSIKDGESRKGQGSRGERESTYMNGRSHTAVNALSAVTINSIFHTVGVAYTWSQLSALMTSTQLANALLAPQLLYKLTYYVLVVLCARLPDVDQDSRFSRLLGGHRGFTHSCLGVLLLCLFFATIIVSLPLLFILGGTLMPSVLLEEIKVGCEAIVTGWVLHIIADSLTKGGVPLLWPNPTRYGFPPKAMWRFKVGTVWEDLLLWTMIFCTGLGIGTGLLGV